MTASRAMVHHTRRRPSGTPLWIFCAAFAMCALRAACAWAILGFVLVAAADPGAARRTPYHEHVVIGGTAAERARVLAAHTRAMVGHPPLPDLHAGHAVPRGSGPAPAGGWPLGAEGPVVGGLDGDGEARARVLVLRAGGPVGPAVFGAGGGAIMASSWPRLPAPRPLIGTVVPPWAPVHDTPPTALDPPPRAS
ncbi:MAG: hypothetical protein QN159_06620 [Armatimonadota bacterium]|nr:hypothetical protein [Armatimonadota bacterium]